MVLVVFLLLMLLFSFLFVARLFAPQKKFLPLPKISAVQWKKYLFALPPRFVKNDEHPCDGWLIFIYRNVVTVSLSLRLSLSFDVTTMK